MASNKEVNPRPMNDNHWKAIASTKEIRLDRLKTSREALKKAKELTITLYDFLKQVYFPRLPEDNHGVFKCTIRDIGIAPFEIDIYDVRMVLVEVTGKTRVNTDGIEEPERLYVSRHYSINSALEDIKWHIRSRKLQALPTSIITLGQYMEATNSYDKYIAYIIKPEYSKALNAMQDRFPFERITTSEDDLDSFYK